MIQEQENGPTERQWIQLPWLLWILNQALIMGFLIGTFHKLAFIFPWEFSKEIPQSQN